MSLRSIIAATASLSLSAAPLAQASAAHPAAIEVRDAWSRPTAPGTPTGVGYLTIGNRGREGDRLIGAATPWAAGASLHRSTMRGGVMSMQPVPEGLPIPPGGAVKLEPGGYHLMLTGLKRPLSPGARVPATLTFQKAGKLRVTFQVRATPPEPRRIR